MLDLYEDMDSDSDSYYVAYALPDGQQIRHTRQPEGLRNVDCRRCDQDHLSVRQSRYLPPGVGLTLTAPDRREDADFVPIPQPEHLRARPVVDVGDLHLVRAYFQERDEIADGALLR